MRLKPIMSIAAAIAILLLTSILAFAQGNSQRETFQAQAMGQGTQLGRMFNITVIINEYSSTEDQQNLLEAFSKGGQRGLVNALSKMPSKGRIAITGTLGYDISYVRQFATPMGRKIRIVTDRPITFGEAWSDSRSEDYNLSALELDISNSKGQSAGTLIPACQFTVDNDKQIQIVAFQNPWRLSDVVDWGNR